MELLKKEIYVIYCTSCSLDRYLYYNQCLTNCINGTVIFQNECVDECPSGSYLDGNICQIPVEYYSVVEIINKKPKYSKTTGIVVITFLVVLCVAEIVFVILHFYGNKIMSIFKKSQQNSEDEDE